MYKAGCRASLLRALNLRQFVDPNAETQHIPPPGGFFSSIFKVYFEICATADIYAFVGNFSHDLTISLRGSRKDIHKSVVQHVCLKENIKD